jgi:hypothetical protein
MKMRRDHVTNSSSSSFLVVVKNDDYHAILAELDEFEREVVEFYSTRFTRQPVLGHDCRVAAFDIDNVDAWAGMPGEPEPGSAPYVEFFDRCWAAWDKFMARVRDRGGVAEER